MLEAQNISDDIKITVFIRPDVAGDVLQTPSLLIDWLIKWVSQPFPPHTQQTFITIKTDFFYYLDFWM